MKRKLVVAGIAAGSLAAGGVAWAMLSGTLNLPDAVQGQVVGAGASACQTTALTFTVPDPVWDATLGDYAVTSLGYSGISSACVTLGTADLVVTVVLSGNVLAQPAALNLQSSTGTLTFPAVSFDEMTRATYNYLVKDA